MNKPLDPRITQEVIANHRALWQWLYDNPARDKEDWPGWKFRPDAYKLCFLCDALKYRTEKRSLWMDCDACPIDWPVRIIRPASYPLCCRSWFEMWEGATDTDARRNLAALIRDGIKETDNA